MIGNLPLVRVFRLFGRGTSALMLYALIAMHSCLASADQAVPPEQVIEQVSSQLLEVLERDRERLREDPRYVYRLADEILAPNIDFARVSSLVLGKHWRKATPAQRSEFAYQFQRLLVRTYATAFSELGNWTLRIAPATMSSNNRRATVKAKLFRPQAAPVDLNYSMNYSDGRWCAYDVKIDGVSLVTNYRSSFAREVRLKGIDGLIGKITSLNNTRVSQIDSS